MAEVSSRWLFRWGPSAAMHCSSGSKNPNARRASANSVAMHPCLMLSRESVGGVLAPEWQKSPRGGFFSWVLLRRCIAQADRKIQMLVELPPVPSLCIHVLCCLEKVSVAHWLRNGRSLLAVAFSLGAFCGDALLKRIEKSKCSSSFRQFRRYASMSHVL